MTEKQVQLIKHSWKLFRSIDPALIGDVFYGKLFQLMPSLKPMFPDSMTEQYIKIVDTLSLVVARLDKLDEINQEITQLAVRHVQYGVKPAHYAVVGQALLWTLEKGLGNDWTPEVAEAWLRCYEKLSNTMILAAYGTS
jgi:hemoglobin-like flavoprotein